MRPSNVATRSFVARTAPSSGTCAASPRATVSASASSVARSARASSRCETRRVSDTGNDAERQRIAALPFDKALAEFKQVVEKLEAGNLPLEESIALFEQGVLLQRRCERMLSEAELRFQRLVESAGGKVRALDLSVGESEEPS